jgi:hypothetical protein
LNERILNEMEKTNVTHRLSFDEREYATVAAAADEDIFQQRSSGGGIRSSRYGRGRGGGENQETSPVVLMDNYHYANVPGAGTYSSSTLSSNLHTSPEAFTQHSSGGGGGDDDDNWISQSRDDWYKFHAFLREILDEYTLRDANLFLHELTRLQTYLNSEYETSKTENGLFFFNQAQIVEHLNTTINVSSCYLSFIIWLFIHYKYFLKD